MTKTILMLTLRGLVTARAGLVIAVPSKDAQAWMIHHFSIPPSATILNFQCDGNPVKAAAISWQTLEAWCTHGSIISSSTLWLTSRIE